MKSRVCSATDRLVQPAAELLHLPLQLRLQLCHLALVRGAALARTVAARLELGLRQAIKTS